MLWRPRWRPLRALPLLARFGITSLVLIAALGVVVCLQLRQIIERREVTSVESITSSALNFIATQDFHSVTQSSSSPTDKQISTLQTSLREWTQSGPVVGIDAWMTPGILVFSDDSSTLNSSTPASPLVHAAFAGKSGADQLSGSDLTYADAHARKLLARYGRLLEVFLPIRIDGGAVIAVVQAYTPYKPVSEAITSDTKRMALLLAAGLLALYLALFRLVASASRRLRRQSKINEELARTDSLTGLPNRALLRERAEHSLTLAQRTGGSVTLMLLDLDRFKEINDSLGHHYGDHVLTMVGSRLQAALRAGDTIARLGGDEFAVLLPEVASGTDALLVAEKLQHALQDPFVSDGVIFDIDVSIGVAISPQHGETFEALLQHADVAMYDAKLTRTEVSLYSAELDRHNPERLALLGELRRAMDDPKQIVLHYQPKAQSASGAVSGVEALVRWQHPTHGLLPPMEFIPAAERTGLIKPLTLVILDRALEQLSRWADEDVRVQVAVNVSTRSLLDLDFPDEVARLLQLHNVSPAYLELEITESTVMADPDRAREVLTALAHMGVRLSLDDFGTGYSSMAYLKSLPIHQIKIDRSFVTNMESDVSDAAIVRSSIELARNLHLDVVAEGVETDAVLQQLRDLGCDSVQGFLLSRPLPATEFASWMRQHERTAIRDYSPAN